MGKARKGNGDVELFDHNADRYPSFKQGLSRILQESRIEDTPIERLEVHFLANGEATYRYWAPRADESDGGVLTP